MQIENVCQTQRASISSVSVINIYRVGKTLCI